MVRIIIMTTMTSATEMVMARVTVMEVIRRLAMIKTVIQTIMIARVATQTMIPPQQSISRT